MQIFGHAAAVTHIHCPGAQQHLGLRLARLLVAVWERMGPHILVQVRAMHLFGDFVFVITLILMYAFVVMRDCDSTPCLDDQTMAVVYDTEQLAGLALVSQISQLHTTHGECA